MSDTPPTEADYPRPPAPENRYPDKPFALRQPPQEIFAAIFASLLVAGVHFGWTSLPLAVRLSSGRWIIPFEIAILVVFLFWNSARAKRTDRPKTARLMFGTAIVFVVLSLAALAFATYQIARVERAVGPGWQRQR